jgi:hypothetical protein
MKVVSKILMATLALSGFASAEAVELAGGKLKINGFADGQLEYTKEQASRGFFLNDAALYVTAGGEKVSLFVDLPFSGGTANNDFSVGTGKAQAYVTLKPANGFEFSMGQFDTIYGLELNDTKDVVFTSQGLVFAAALPTTHQGAMVAYSTQGVTVKALVSNPNNQGILNDNNPEYGAQVSYAHGDQFNLALGYLAHNQRGAAGTDTLVNFVAGANFGMINVGAEVDYNKVGDADAAYGYLGQIVAEANQELSFGVRGEWLKRFTNYQAMQFTFGPQFKPADYDGLTVKADYTWTSTEATKGATKDKEHTVALAAVYAF